MGSVKKVVMVVVVSTLIASACSSSGEDDDAGSVIGAPRSGEVFEFGEPASPSEATRVIEIDANDDFSFSPDSVEVAAGETITFRVSGTGSLAHEFTLGDEATQDAHAEEMGQMDGMEMDDDPNAISIGAGETTELTWKFERPGDLLMACHVAGHYESGMRGEIVVTEAN